MTAAELAHRLDAKRNGKGWVANCPAHEDRNASLCIDEGNDGRTLLHCHAGCAVDAICEALSIRTADLFPESMGRGMVQPTPKKTAPARKSGKIHSTIDDAARAACWGVEQSTGHKWTETRRDMYKADEGDPVAAVLRFDRADGATDSDDKKIKSFRPVHAVAEGWRLGDPAGKWPLLNLPAILSTDGPVFVVEGEKAACAGAEIGLTTTTSAHGAKSPHKTNWSPLHGRDVVILPDRDRSGRGYADTVAGLVHTAGARSIKIVELPDLPPKGDLVDFIAARADR